METVVISPTATELVKVCVVRSAGPPRWSIGDRGRSDRLRSAIANTGFSLPTGDISVSIGGPTAEENDLAVALAILLCDPAHAHLRRRWWIAWGALRLDGGLEGANELLLNDLPAGPCAGRIWVPDDHVPSSDEDAVISLVDVEDLRQAWEVLVFFAGAEEVITEDAIDRVATHNGAP